MERSSRTELGRTMTEMLTVLLIISVVIILSISGFQNIRDRVVADALQKAIGTNIAQRIHETQGPSAYDAKPLTYLGPYKYLFHVENGTLSAGIKKGYYWISIGSLSGDKAKAVSPSLCRRLLNNLNLPVMPSFISVNDVPAEVSSEACKYEINGLVLTLYFQKSSASDVASTNDFINATYSRSCTSTSQCGGCQVCNNGHCVNDQSKCPAGTICTEGFCKCSDERLACDNTCCANNQVCGNLSVSQMSCISNNNLACMINADCDAPGKCSTGTGKCYCDVDYNAGVSPIELKDSTQCRPITPFTSQFQFNGKTFYIGPRTSYWSAENFCLAHEKQLATFDSLGLPNDFSCDATQTTCPLYHILNGINAPTAFYWTHSKHSSTYTKRLRFVQAKKEDSYPGIYSGAAILGGSSTSYTLCEDKLPDADIPEIPDNSCTSNDQCESSQVCTNGQCVLKTCERNEFTDINNQCVPCSDTARHTSSQANCSACNGTREFIDNQYCDLICPSGYFKDDDGNCVLCTEPDQVQAEASECNKCNTTYARYMDIGWCKVGGDCATGYFKDNSGACHLCSEASNIASSSQQCSKCPDRNFYNNICYAACAGNSYFQDGTCQGCVNGQTFATSSDACQDCNSNYKFIATSSACSSCGKNNKNEDVRFFMDVTENNITTTYCVRNCPDDHFRNLNGNCTICSLSVGKVTTPDQCNRCNQTNYHRYMDGNTCKRLDSCVSGWFKDKTGKCQRCANIAKYEVASATDCAACNNTLSPRIMGDNNMCILQTCPSEYFREDSTQNCLPCDQPQSIISSNCSACQNRELIGNQCLLRCTLGQFFRVQKESDNFADVPPAGSCTACDNHYASITTEESCNNCPTQRTWVENARGDGKARCIWNGSSGWFQNKNLNWTDCSNDTAAGKEINATQEAKDLCLSCNNTPNKRHVETKSNGRVYCVPGA